MQYAIYYLSTCVYFLLHNIWSKEIILIVHFNNTIGEVKIIIGGSNI